MKAFLLQCPSKTSPVVKTINLFPRTARYYSALSSAIRQEAVHIFLLWWLLSMTYHVSAAINYICHAINLSAWEEEQRTIKISAHASCTKHDGSNGSAD